MKATGHEVWVLDDDASIRWVLEQSLVEAGHTVRVFETAEALGQALQADRPAALITDIRLPGESGLDVLAALGKRKEAPPVIVMTAHSDLDSAVSAFEAGAFDYLAKPFDIDELIDCVDRALRARQPETAPPRETRSDADQLIGESTAMQTLYRTIGRLSRSSMSVLITGESGSGKELVARALHRHSPRARGPFIPLNSAAIPGDLLESELFGHERGAFTGAQQRRIGRFEQAHRGTLFLDEIGDMPAALQTRL
ncbi:MAG: sigma 54-interacting transcriptional regulator, partial [Gammaproteobacteria bacterium]